MPVEFICPGCSRKLRTPDESAGKKAKCPQCGTIVDVPGASAPAQESAPAPPEFRPSEASFQGFQRFDEGGTAPAPSAFDPTNPYASPSAFAAFQPAKATAGQMSQQRVAVDEVFNRTWAIFQTQVGQCALFGLVFMAISFGVGMANNIAGGALQAMNDPVITGVAILGQQLIAFLVNTFFQMGLTIFALRLARTGEARLNDLFSGGPFYLRGLAASLLFQLLLMSIALVFLAPGLLAIITQDPRIFVPALVIGGILALVVVVLVALRFYFLIVFIVDQDASVGEAFRGSATYMAGNKMTAFLGGLLMSVLGGIVTLCTCAVGAILVVPFAGLFMAVFYLLATGQPTYMPSTLKGVQQFRPAQNGPM